MIQLLTHQFLSSGPGGVLKKSTNAVAKKRRKAGGATVKKAVVGPTKKLAQGVVKESNLGNLSMQLHYSPKRLIVLSHIQTVLFE